MTSARSRRLCGHPHPDQPRTKAWCELLPDHAEEQHRSGNWSWFTQGISWWTEPTSPPLPPSLRSVDDVRRTCEAAGLVNDGVFLWGDETCRVHVDIYRHKLECIYVERSDYFNLATMRAGGPSSLLLAAIRSAREETP